MREVQAQFENPVLLFSGGKDSIVLTHLAKKAFYPAKIPFPLVHIDTGHNFPETISFRDNLVEKLDVKLIVGSVQESIDSAKLKRKQVIMLLNSSKVFLDTIEENKVDAEWVEQDVTKKARAKNASFHQG